MKRVFGAALVAFAAVTHGATNASASIITATSVTLSAADEGTTFNVEFDGNVEQTDIPGLSGTITFTLTDYDATNNWAIFDVEVENTSTVDGSRISAFGFNTNPDVTTGSSTSLIFTDVEVDTDGNPPHQQFPNQFGSIEVCVTGQNCPGGGGTGVSKGDTSPLFSLTLNFADLQTSLLLDNFGVRYQSIEGVTAGTSGTGSGTPCVPGDCPSDETDPIPEPATLMLLGSGLLALGYARRRR